MAETTKHSVQTKESRNPIIDAPFTRPSATTETLVRSLIISPRRKGSHGTGGIGKPINAGRRRRVRPTEETEANTDRIAFVETIAQKRENHVSHEGDGSDCPPAKRSQKEKSGV